MVRFSPSSSFIDGVHPSLSEASEISSFRCKGSSNSLDQIIHTTETPGLGPIPEHRDILPQERLHNKITHHPAVVRVHARSIGFEDANHPDIDPVLPVIIKKQGFHTPLSFVITGTQADGVHISPVAFGLPMHGRVAVYLAGGGLKDFRFYPLGKPQHMYGAQDAGSIVFLQGDG
jgi:hypothetical protein